MQNDEYGTRLKFSNKNPNKQSIFMICLNCQMNSCIPQNTTPRIALVFKMYWQILHYVHLFIMCKDSWSLLH
jgi:hypothetical protein